MTAIPKTIQIYLPAGDPQGIRVAEITTRVVQVIEVPRSLLQDFLKMPESDQVALYFLFGESDDCAEHKVYIGQTGSLRAGLKSHNKEKEFWQRALVLVSRTHSLTQTHALFLEWYCLQASRSAGRFTDENGNSGSKPHTPALLEADCLEKPNKHSKPMSDPAAERAFQDEIIDHLTAHAWLLGSSSNYDRERAIYPEDVVGYFKDTQPEAWKRICANHPQAPEEALLRKVTAQLEKVDSNASTAEMRKYGTLEVLRHPFKEPWRDDQTLPVQAGSRAEPGHAGRLRSESPAGGAGTQLFTPCQIPGHGREEHQQELAHRSGVVRQRDSGGDVGAEKRIQTGG